MTVTAAGGVPLIIIGGTTRQGNQDLPAITGTTLDATLEAVIYYGQIFTEDGASHTIDTSGSSSLGWRAGTSTFANVGSSLKIGLSTIDAANGPPARAVNVANLITYDVSKTLTGGTGPLASGTWNEHVPDTGTKTIANGDLVAFCVQIVTVGGADTVSVSANSNTSSSQRPGVTQFTGGSYAAANATPNCVITFSDGTLGFFVGTSSCVTPSSNQTWNSGSATKEYGNYFKMPFPGAVYGLIANCTFGGDTDLVLYSDPLGTPVAEKTLAIDLNTISTAANSRWMTAWFPAPYTFTANQELAGIMKPGGTNVTGVFMTMNSANHQKGMSLGANCYAINRASGAFAAQNTNKDRFAMALIVGAFDSGGGTGGVSRARVAGGF